MQTCLTAGPGHWASSHTNITEPLVGHFYGVVFYMKPCSPQGLGATFSFTDEHTPFTQTSEGTVHSNGESPASHSKWTLHASQLCGSCARGHHDGAFPPAGRTFNSEYRRHCVPVNWESPLNCAHLTREQTARNYRILTRALRLHLSRRLRHS